MGVGGSIFSSPSSSLDDAPLLGRAPVSPWGDAPDELEYCRLRAVRCERAFVVSPYSGLALFTRSWSPSQEAPNPTASPRALLFMLHGYGNDTGWTFQLSAVALAQSGYAVFAIDLPGHGRSEGLCGFLPNLDLVARDCAHAFRSARQRWSGGESSFATPSHRLPCFLYGESLGGALALLLHLSTPPRVWDGAILVAPMCQISPSMKPNWLLSQILSLLSLLAPSWPIVPAKDLVDKSVKDPAKRELGRRNPLRYAGKPRLGTARELLRVTEYLGARLSDVDLPLLVLHGDADVVTDPSVSKSLYEKAKSQDKTLKLYRGMWHSLLQGEPDENARIVLADIVAWLDERVRTPPKAAPPPRGSLEGGGALDNNNTQESLGSVLQPANY